MLAQRLSTIIPTSYLWRIPGDNQRVSKVKFSTSLRLPQTNKNHKTGNYFSTLDVCQVLGINHKTYRRHEGKLFPQAQRDPNTGFRIFTEKQIIELKALWNKKTEYLHKKRHYHYHKTGDFYSLSEACKIIGISTVTFRKHEGTPFPLVRRDKNGRRLFTKENIEQIKEVWENHTGKAKLYHNRTGVPNPTPNVLGKT